MSDPINIMWCVLGIVVWPELTLCGILWLLGHPILGIMALLFGVDSPLRVYTYKTITHFLAGHVIEEDDMEE